MAYGLVDAAGNALGMGQRPERKLLITVVEWTGASHDVYTLVTEEPSPFNPTQYYKRTSSGWTAGQSGETWAANPWYSKTTSTNYREILGVRTEDSSIEFNLDTETTTDILGVTYTDLKKTEPQQDFDPFNITGDSALAQYLTEAALKNEINSYNQKFDVYIIAGFMKDTNKYFAVKHTKCSIYPTGIGGDAYVGIPIEVHYSNDIQVGSVNKLSNDFTFTAD